MPSGAGFLVIEFAKPGGYRATGPDIGEELVQMATGGELDQEDGAQTFSERPKR